MFSMEMPGSVPKSEASGKRIPVATQQEMWILVLITSFVLWHWCLSCKIRVKVKAEGGQVGKAGEKEAENQVFV